ncbi:hypothetical protein AAFF_G00052530, partial [Aldrovandia affinis]
MLPPSGDAVPAAPPPASQLPATAAQSPGTTNRPPATEGRNDLALGSTPTLVAEVMWTLETVVKHQSYNSNEGIGKLFAPMFPDSDIAKTFACGGDKTAYITKFGLAEYIKRDLVAKVNNGPFVVTFDESFNKATKTKQLDMHVRFWDEGKVQSRYLGSQFMGHATAQDLLANVKVMLYWSSSVLSCPLRGEVR